MLFVCYIYLRAVCEKKIYLISLKVRTWCCYFRNVQALFIRHEAQNGENGKASHNAGGAVQQTQVETVPARKKKMYIKVFM